METVISLEEDTELQYISIVLFRMLLRGVDEMDRSNMPGNILNSIVPLLIQLSNGHTKEASRNTLKSGASFMNWEYVPSHLFHYKIYDSLHSMYSAICPVIISKCKQSLPDVMAQMLDFLRSKNPSY
ncbi:uncharacterized protein M6D78_002026 [Vipera latastei]